MPDYQFGTKLAPDPVNPMTSYEIEADIARSGVQKVQLKAAVDKQAKSELLKNAIQKHTKYDPQTGAPSIDHAGVIGDLYRADPELGQAYEDDVQSRAAVAMKTQRDNADYKQKAVTAALSAVDLSDTSPAGLAKAKAQWDAGVQQLKGLGVPLSPQDEVFDPARAQMLQRQAVGAGTIYKGENDLTKTNATNTSREAIAAGNVAGATERAKIAAQGGVDRANIMGNASVNRAAITANGGITKAQIGAAGKGGNGVGLDAVAPAPNPFVGRFRMTSGPGPRTAPTPGASTNHLGTDYAVPLNTPVPAMQDGVVVEAGNKGKLGNFVRVKFADGTEQGYGHLGTVQVKPGQSVGKGQVLGLSGNTGVSTGPHVHVRDYPGTAAAAPDGTGTSTDALGVANDVLAYKGKTNLDFRGETTMGKFPETKALMGTDFEGQVRDMNSLIKAVQRGATTGPGAGAQNLKDRAGMALSDLTGISALRSKGDEQRVSDYASISRVAGDAARSALKALYPVTDRDLSTIMERTIGPGQTGKFNIATATLYRDAAWLAQQKKDFFTKWANVAGSPVKTQRGITAGEAWQAKSAGWQKEIADRYNRLSSPDKAKSSASAANAPTVVRQLRNKSDGQLYNQMSNGSMVRVGK